jgi:hypothetical protein
MNSLDQFKCVSAWILRAWLLKTYLRKRWPRSPPIVAVPMLAFGSRETVARVGRVAFAGITARSLLGQ